jgi:hypothetical protein
MDSAPRSISPPWSPLCDPYPSRSSPMPPIEDKTPSIFSMKDDPNRLGMRRHAPACAANQTACGSGSHGFKSRRRYHSLSLSKQSLCLAFLEGLERAFGSDWGPHRVPRTKFAEPPPEKHPPEHRRAKSSPGSVPLSLWMSLGSSRDELNCHERPKRRIDVGECEGRVFAWRDEAS